MSLRICCAIVAMGCNACGGLHAQPEERFVFERVFTTSDHRARIDAARNRSASSAAASTMPAVVPAPVTLRGLVTRSHGRPTVWINGVSTFAGSALEGGVRVHPDTISAEEVTVFVPGREPLVMRPGETYLPSTTRIETIVVRRGHQ